MGGCLSKKAKKDPNTSLLGSKKEAEGSRDPPPTESPPQIEEEKVKEVLSETPTRFVRANSNRREPAKVANRLRMEELDLGSYINAADLCSSRSVGVLDNPPSESIYAASTSLISDNTGAAAPHDDDDDDDDEEGETAEMKLKMMLMKKKKKRSLSSSSVGMPRSRSPAAKTRGPAPAAAAGKREFRAVDVGCRSGRPSPSPMRSREMGNYARNHINSSSSCNGNIYNNTKTGDMVLIGERDGRRMRSMSPAASSLKSRSSELEAAAAAAAAATKISLDHQHQQRGRHCRSLSSSTATNGRFSPQRIPARALDLGARRRGNPNAGGGSAGDGDGMTLLMEEGKEESLENPLVSLECFIFL